MQQDSQCIFMVRPAHFGFNEQTALSNTFQHSIVTGVNLREQVLAEFDAAVDTLRNAGIEVLVFDDTEDIIRPDAVFPNNWISTHHDGTIVLYPMQTVNRRAERRTDLIAALKEKYVVKKIIDLSGAEAQEQFLEGTGSIVFDHTARIAYACLSPRTSLQLLEHLCTLIGYTPVSFHAVNEQGIDIYHTNVIMGIAADYAIACLDCIPDPQEKQKVIQALSTSGKTILEINLEQVKSFAGNVLSLKTRQGKSVLALSASAYKAMNTQQLEQLDQVTSLLPINIPIIETIGGGSVRCMLAQNFLAEKH